MQPLWHIFGELHHQIRREGNPSLLFPALVIITWITFGFRIDDPWFIISNKLKNCNQPREGGGRD
jgi:hypothetical protein